MAVDVRIKFEQDHPKILHVKRNEAKIVVFDVLSLHRYVICKMLCLINAALATQIPRRPRIYTPQLIIVVGVARQRERAQ